MVTTSNWQGTAEMVRRVSSGKGRRLTGLYVIEGYRLLERALRAGVPLQKAVFGESFGSDPASRGGRLLADLRASGCTLVVAPDEVIAELTEGRDLGPVFALLPIPRPAALGELLAFPNDHPPVFLVALDIVDPGNVGALVRTAHASGAVALLTSGASDAFHPRATYTSRGSIFKLPVISYETAAALLDDTRRLGIGTVGAVAERGQPLPEAKLPARPLAVVMGNEAQGLPDDVQAVLDCLVTIPMPAGVDSFAVNAAAAVVLYEVSRRYSQRD